MSDELRDHIRNSLKMKDIYELLEIWRTNNRTEWSDTTFEVLREILEERIREVPLQNEPLLEIKDDAPANKLDDENLEEWKANLLDREDQPELYNTLDVLNLIENIDKVAIAVVVIYILLGLLNFSFVRMLFQGVEFSSSDVVQSLPNMLFSALSIGLVIAIIYFPLKALAVILRILMEMEFSSRKTS